MSFFLKNILHFLFGKSLNGMMFAERERETERQTPTREYVVVIARAYNHFFRNIIRTIDFFYEQCGVFCVLLRQLFPHKNQFI